MCYELLSSGAIVCRNVYINIVGVNDSPCVVCLHLTCHVVQYMTSEKCGGCLLIAVSMCLVKAGLDVVGQDAETQIAVIQISRCVGVYVMDKNG